jgi:hypothetical protein
MTAGTVSHLFLDFLHSIDVGARGRGEQDQRAKGVVQGMLQEMRRFRWEELQMCVRCVVGLILGIIASTASWADTIRLHCSETLYDKTQNKPYDVPQLFILQDFSTLRWDNKKVDLSVVTTTLEAIEAIGKTTANMPRPTQIDQCVSAELANRPTERDANGTVNKYLVVDCEKRAEMSGDEVPIDVSVTISRITGELTIRRGQDNNSQHDTLHDGSCKVFKPLF